MERGLIVISSNNGGLDEILEGYKYKYNPYKVGELNKTIRQFQEDSNKIIEEQQRILLKNLKRFSAKEMVREYEKVWIGLMGRIILTVITTYIDAGGYANERLQ